MGLAKGARFTSINDRVQVYSVVCLLGHLMTILMNQMIARNILSTRMYNQL